MIFIADPLPDGWLLQTCLSSPKSLACTDCLEKGETGNMCGRCELLNQLIFKNETINAADEEYYNEYCNDSK